MAVASPCDELIPLILFPGAYDSKGSLEDQWQIPFSLKFFLLYSLASLFSLVGLVVSLFSPCWTRGFFIFVGFVVNFSPLLPFRKSP